MKEKNCWQQTKKHTVYIKKYKAWYNSFLVVVFLTLNAVIFQTLEFKGQ